MWRGEWAAELKKDRGLEERPHQEIRGVKTGADVHSEEGGCPSEAFLHPSSSQSQTLLVEDSRST